MKHKTVVLKLAQGTFKVLFTGIQVLNPKTKKPLIVNRFPGCDFSQKELVNLCNYVIANG